jgi:hypothetical protein
MGLLPLLMVAAFVGGAEVKEGDAKVLRGKKQVFIQVGLGGKIERWATNFLLNRGVSVADLPKTSRFHIVNWQLVKGDLNSLVMRVSAPAWPDGTFGAWVEVYDSTWNKTRGLVDQNVIWRRSAELPSTAKQQVRLREYLSQFAADWRLAHK